MTCFLPSYCEYISIFFFFFQDNAKLLQHNQELFLKATGEITPKEKVDSLKEYKEYVGEDFFNSLTNKQQKLLITILEGEDE